MKYRSSPYYGGGVSAITPAKLRQMRFAAELYQARQKKPGDAQLLVVTIDASGSTQLFEVE